MFGNYSESSWLKSLFWLEVQQLLIVKIILILISPWSNEIIEKRISVYIPKSLKGILSDTK